MVEAGSNLDKSRSTFKIFDVPNWLINEYIAYAKLYTNNQVWKVMDQGMQLLQNDMVSIQDLEKAQLEFQQAVHDEIKALKEEIKRIKGGEKEIKTFKGRLK